MKNCWKLITTGVVILFTYVLLFGSVTASAQTNLTPLAMLIHLDTGGSSQIIPVSGAPQEIQGTVGTPLKATVLAAGGKPAYRWSLASGSLPPGLHVNGSTLTWMPTVTGTWSSVIKVVDSSYPAQFTTQALLVIIRDAPNVSITSTGLAVGQNGTAYNASLQAQGGIPGYIWSLQSGSLPAGLTLSPSGVISGMPTSSGVSTFSVAVADTSSPAHTATGTFSLQVKSLPLALVTPKLVSGQAGVAYAAALQASGGTPAYTWTLTSGSLPAGINLSATTGVLAGQPTTAGTSNFTIAVTDNGSPAQTQLASASIVIANAPASATNGNTWYVRRDGGTRYSSNVTNGQCDGLANAAYSGTGVNQHCAFNDARYLYQDASYSTGGNFPSWGWVGNGGDTYMIMGSIADGVSYRIGYNTDGTTANYCTSKTGVMGCFGIAGNPYNSGMPTPLSGTPSQHTRILGGNYGNCRTATAKTQLHGGYAASNVINMAGASYVDLQCLDITDFSACGRSSQMRSCSHDTPADDYAVVGIAWNNKSTHDVLTDIHIHGMAFAGMGGPTGDGVEMHNLDLLGNAGSGWNADPSDGTTGVGQLLVQNYNISWNGCAEEYPIVHALPYGDCTDQNDGGYGDGFGTATVASPAPGWQVTFDQGEVAYNTQDGLDALHLTGPGSLMTVTRTLAYSNMGQQIKVGGAQGTVMNNVLVGNCSAMSQPIPGTPSNYNQNLSLFCRADNTPLVVTVGHGTTTTVQHNTIVGNGSILTSVVCDPTGGNCDTTALMDYRDNAQIGNFNASRGTNPGGVYTLVWDGTYTNPSTCNAAPNHFWQTDGFTGCQTNPFGNPGSFRDHNAVLNAKEGCPAQFETNALCGSPGLGSEIMPAIGFSDLTLAGTNSPAYHAGTAITGIAMDYAGKSYGSIPSIGALEFGSTIVRH